ncbi:serine threonine protein kinase [Penicillium concentricum]|uniref:Serine threonine protein kinase n=1 Tax=Penicillium concentricum TaxID=293559 RepID=A0A9W9SBB5_9EURO|nr:serine threonine protein kinase [Penicillium concentricum]KAJ5375501.1 serine threonine protein kinase [Penicillium concentricum]
MDRSGRLFSFDTSSFSTRPQEITTTTLPNLSQAQLNLASDDASLKLQQAARADPDFVDVFWASVHYDIPFRSIDKIGLEGLDEEPQVFSIGSGLTSEVVQHMLVDEDAELQPPPSTTIALKIFRSTKMDTPNDAKAARQKVYHSILKEMMAFGHSALSSHPHILKLLFIGWNLDHAYPLLAMELGDHGSLDYIIRDLGPGPTTRQKRHLTIDIALGLQAIHEAGFTHGDLKPDNIIIFSSEDPTRQVVAKLTDFGGSNQMHGEHAGTPTHITPLWSAPEVLGKHPKIDWRFADIYSYGLVVASLWAGRESSEIYGQRARDEDGDCDQPPTSTTSSSSSVLSSLSTSVSLAPEEEQEGLRYLKKLPEDHPGSLMSFLRERITKESLPADIDPSEVFAIITPTLKPDWMMRPDMDGLMVIISEFSNAIGRAIELLADLEVSEASNTTPHSYIPERIYEPKPVRSPLIDAYPGSPLLVTNHQQIMTTHTLRALDEINDRIKYKPQPEDIPDHFPEDLTTDQFLGILLAKTESNQSDLYNAIKSDLKEDIWPRVLDIIKKGYFLSNLGMRGLFALDARQTPDSKKRALEYLRTSALYQNETGIMAATFALSTGHAPHESEIPIRLNLTLLALSHSSLAIRRLHSTWPDLYVIVSKVIRERGLGCLEEAKTIHPGLYNTQRLIRAYCAQAASPSPTGLTPLSLGDALDIGATEVIREILERPDDSFTADEEQTIYSLFHRLSKVPDAEAAALCRTAYEQGANLDCLLEMDMTDLLVLTSNRTPNTPLCVALARGQPILAFEIFCLHVEFDVPIRKFALALFWSFLNHFPEVGEALLRLFQDNPAMCLDDDTPLSGGNADSMVDILSAIMVTSMLPPNKSASFMLHGGEHEAAYMRTQSLLLDEGADPALGAATETSLGISIVADDVMSLNRFIKHMEMTARKEARKSVNDVLLASLNDPCNLASFQYMTLGAEVEKASVDVVYMYRWEYMYTALALCLRHGSLACFKLLLTKVPSLVNIEVDLMGRTLLHRACSGVEKKVHNVKNYSHEHVPALMALITRSSFSGGSSVEFVDLLLKAGADVMATDSRGHTALFWALQQANIPAADMIASHCSQDQLKHMLRRDPSTGDSIFAALIRFEFDGDTILNALGNRRQPRLVESFLWLQGREAVYFHGPRDLPVWSWILNHQRSLRTGELMDANIMEYLIDVPLFSESLRTERYKGFSLLHSAVWHGNVEIVHLLLARNFDPNVIAEVEAGRAGLISGTPLDSLAHFIGSGRNPSGIVKASESVVRKWEDKLLDIANLLLDHGGRGETFEAARQLASFVNNARNSSGTSEELDSFLELLRDMEVPAQSLQLENKLETWPRPLPSDDHADVIPNAKAAALMSIDSLYDVSLNEIEIIAEAFRRLDQRRRGQLGEKQILLLEWLHANAVGGQPLGDATMKTANTSGGFQKRTIIIDNADNNPRNGTTRLHHAVQQGNLGALMDALDSTGDVDAEDAEGRSALEFAVLLGATRERTGVIELLLQAGANPNRSPAQSPSPPIAKVTPALHLCIMLRDDPDLVETLVTAGADVNMLDSERQSPLMLAVTFGRVVTMGLLLHAGADITERNTKGQSLLHVFVIEDQPRILSLLLELLSNEQVETGQKRMVDAGTESTGLSGEETDGYAPLHFAARDGNIMAMIVLINEGKADPNVQDNCGCTPLHYAVLDGTADAVEILIDVAGADVDARASFEATPLVIWVTKYFGKVGADVRIRDLLLAGDADVGVVTEFQYFVRTDGEPGCWYIYVGKGKGRDLLQAQTVSGAHGAPWVECDPLIALDGVI